MRILKDFRRWLPGVVVSLVILFILSRAVDWNSVVFAFRSIDPRFLLLHGLCYFALIFARAMASKVLLDNRPTLRDSVIIMMQGYLLNNILPFRLGELGRAYLLGRKTGLGMFNALPAIVIERFYDLAFAALVLVSTLPFVLSGVEWAGPVAYTTLALVSIGLLSLHLVARYRLVIRAWVDRLAKRLPVVEKYVLPQIDAFLDGLAVLTNLRSFSASLLWMALAWGFGVAGQFALLRGLLPDAPLLYSSFALGASSFASAIPSAPSALGVYEGAVVAALAVLGVNAGIGLAFAVLHHIAHILYSGVVGMYGFSRGEIGVMELYEQLTSKKRSDLLN